MRDSFFTLKSSDTPFKRRIKIEPRFLVHLTPTASELLDLSFFRSYKFFADAPLFPRLVDLVHAFNGVNMEQFKRRVEKLLNESILLCRLLKLHFKSLQTLQMLKNASSREVRMKLTFIIMYYVILALLHSIFHSTRIC